MKTTYHYSLEKMRKTMKRTCDVCGKRIPQGTCYKLTETRDTIINGKLQQTLAGCIEPKYGHDNCLKQIERR